MNSRLLLLELQYCGKWINVGLQTKFLYRKVTERQCIFLVIEDKKKNKETEFFSIFIL